MLDKFRWVLQLIENPHRCRIIQLLTVTGLGFSDIMYTLRINPRSLSSHLKWLIAHGVVEKNYTSKMYELTEKGRVLVGLRFINFEEMHKLVK